MYGSVSQQHALCRVIRRERLIQIDLPLDTNVDIAVVDLDEADFDLVALVDFEALVDLDAFFFVDLAVVVDPLEAIGWNIVHKELKDRVSNIDFWVSRYQDFKGVNTVLTFGFLFWIRILISLGSFHSRGSFRSLGSVRSICKF